MRAGFGVHGCLGSVLSNRSSERAGPRRALGCDGVTCVLGRDVLGVGATCERGGATYTYQSNGRIISRDNYFNYSNY